MVFMKASHVMTIRPKHRAQSATGKRVKKEKRTVTGKFINRATRDKARKKHMKNKTGRFEETRRGT